MENRDRFQVFFNYIYCIAFSTYTFLSIFILFSNFSVQSIDMMDFYKIFQIALIVVLFMIVIFRSYKGMTLIYMLGCIALATFGYYITRDARMIMFFLFAFASRFVNPNKLFKMDFVMRVIGFISVLLLYKLDILQNMILSRADGRTRFALGFGHPNYGGLVLFSIILEWILIKHKKINIIEYIFMLGISYYFYRFFLARTDFVLTILLLVATFFVQTLSAHRVMKFLKNIIIPWICWILALFSFAILVFVHSGTRIYTEINGLLSSRLDIANFYYQTAGIHVLPQKITMYFQDSTFAGIDNAFIYIGIFDGIIMLILFCVMEQVIAKKLKYASYTFCLIYIFIMLIGMTEALIVYPFINMMVVFYGQNKNDLLKE